MDAREQKAYQIAATMPLRRDATGWIVPSQSSNGTYRVSPQAAPEMQPWQCSCPDYGLRRKPCKHVMAVELVICREYFYSDGTKVTEQVKVTYSQDWTNYNAAQCAEGDLFPAMLADLCSTLSRPYGGRGRPSLPLSDMVYNCVSKVYEGKSARRFDSEVRAAKREGLTEVEPGFNSVLRYMAKPELTPYLEGLVRISAAPLAAVEPHIAQDSTGFSTCRYASWFDNKWGKQVKRHEFVKLHAMTGTHTNVVTAATVNKSGADSLQFIPLLNETVERFSPREVSADKAYSSKANLQGAENLGITPFVPFKDSPSIRAIDLANPPAAPVPTAPTWDKMFHYFAYNQGAFLAHYHRRSNVETTFSMIKAKFGGSLFSKSYEGQVNEVLCKVIAHNICCLISAMHELGIAMPQFSHRSNLELVG